MIQSPNSLTRPLIKLVLCVAVLASPFLITLPLVWSAVALATTVKVFNKAATNKPQRDVAKHLANLSFNAFGGVVRLNWPLDQQFSGVGNTASVGEMSLSAYTGGTTGLMGCHVIYEPF